MLLDVYRTAHVALAFELCIIIVVIIIIIKIISNNSNINHKHHLLYKIKPWLRPGHVPGEESDSNK